MQILYRHPKLYDFLARSLYSQRVLRKFREAVNKNHTIFDVAAGYGRVASLIDPSNIYHGIDLNPIFVAYARKRGVDVELRNIFDSKAYRKSDVFTLVDVVHHVPSAKLRELFDLIFSHTAKRVVIVESVFLGITRRYGIFGKMLGRLFSFIDDDGFNRIERWPTNAEYQKLFTDRFGSEIGKRFDIQQSLTDKHYIVVFTAPL